MDNVADIYPLSPVQLGMLFHTLAGETGVYINQYTCQLKGAVDSDRLRQAWQQTVAHHPVLRTAFLWEGLDEPLQVVRSQVSLPWSLLDWQHLTDPAAELATFLQRDRQRPFDLAQAPLLRLTLIRLSDTCTQLVWTSHHLLFDGWSLPLIWQDLLACYQGQQPTSRRPYRDFIAWQQQQHTAASKPFWRSQLQAATAPTPLPAARTGGRPSSSYQQCTRRLTPALTAAINAFVRGQRLTLNTLVQAAWALLLHHYSGHHQVTYGAVVSGRPASLAGVETMVGLFINTLPVSVAIDADAHLTDWLQQRQQQLLDLRQHEATPLSDIQRWRGLGNTAPGGSELGSGTLFNSIVVFENYPSTDADNLPFTVEQARYLEQSNYPLALLVLPGDALELMLLHDTGQFESGAVEHLLDYLELLLTTAVEQPQIRLSALPRLTPQQLPSPQPSSSLACVHTLIEAQAAATPHAAAVQFDDHILTYSELNQRANQLARQICAYRPDANAADSAPTRAASPPPPSSPPFIAICLERSTDLVVAILAVLKAGAAYVPLDPAYPAARLTHCLQDTQPQLLLTQRSVALPEGNWPCLYREDWRSAGSDSTENLNLPVSLDDLAYVIYTSGSTGQPKGVLVNHRNLAHSTTARFQVYPDPVERFLLLSSVGFDSSVAGLFWTLCQGGCLVLAPRRIEQDLHQLATLIAQRRVTHTLCVPTLYQLLVAEANPQQLASLKTVIVAGEACPRSLVAQHYQQLPNTALYNEYGPTEGTVWCTAHRIPAVLPPGPVSIGTVIPNASILLLDHHLRPVPVGAVGELCIGGSGVTQGYLNQPKKTAQAFVLVLGVTAGDKTLPGMVYRTGDLARYRADGTLEWLGRRDRQVKIRGYRIELGEIEDGLRSLPAVQDAVVIAATVPAPSDSADNTLIKDLTDALAVLPLQEAEALLTAVEGGE